MKYSAKQLSNGKWAVFSGKKYFINTVHNNEFYVKRRAIELSAQWYQSKIDECKNSWFDIQIKNGQNIDESNWSNILA